MINITNLSVNLGGFVLNNINLEIKKGEYFVILGPTGAGKTVILETIAGLYQSKNGSIEINGNDITNEEPRKRNIGIVYQDYMLFPHLSAGDNVKFGLKNGEMGYYEEIMDFLGIRHLLHRKIHTLSGGESQLVALARALVTKPPVILLDEPLAALDQRKRKRIRDELSRINKERGVTVVHVTHDQTEAMVLADRMAVMMQGQIKQVGTPYEISNKPLDEQIADFVGVENILTGIIRDNKNGVGEIEADMGCSLFSITPYREGRVKLFIRPEDITLSKERKKDSARNEVLTRIEKITNVGPLNQVKMDAGLVALITKQSSEILNLQNGDGVYAAFKAASVHVVRCP